MNSRARLSKQIAEPKKGSQGIMGREMNKSYAESHGLITSAMVKTEKAKMTPDYARKVLIELKLITKNGNPTSRFR